MASSVRSISSVAKAEVRAQRPAGRQQVVSVRAVADGACQKSELLYFVTGSVPDRFFIAALFLQANVKLVSFRQFSLSVPSALLSPRSLRLRSEMRRTTFRTVGEHLFRQLEAQLSPVLPGRSAPL